MLKRFIKDGVLAPLVQSIYKGRPFFGIARYWSVLKEFKTYRRMVRKQNLDERVALGSFHACIFDKEAAAGHVDGYLFQDTWCARKVALAKPRVHVDVGSTLLAMAVMAQYTNVVLVDIRPLQISLPGLSFRVGTLLDLPFDSDSVDSISSLNVVEHVGLGRYGDPLDPLGTDRACQELARVLKPGGALYVAVPIARHANTYFNAHRVFTRAGFAAKLPTLFLVEECFATERGLITPKEYEDIGMPYAYGCFQFSKR